MQLLPFDEELDVNGSDDETEVGQLDSYPVELNYRVGAPAGHADSEDSLSAALPLLD